MRRTHVLVLSILLLVLPRAAIGQVPEPIVDQGPEEALIYTPVDLEWQAGPASLPPGIEFVILEGDPSEPGVFTMRFRAPDGYVIPPHWHTGTERLTVLSGVFHLGHGEQFDRQAAERLPAGSHFSLPPEERHFAFTEGETVVQLSSVGPWQITYVNPADDPR
jgi:quercetin dioxygenase-like cupin family protein